MMSLSVRFFASLKEDVGQDAMEVEVASGMVVKDLLDRLADDLGASAYAALTAENVRIAVNHELLAAPGDLVSTRLRAGDEIAFLPPVTGG